MNKSSYHFPLLLGIIALSFSESAAQVWQQINGYTGPWVNALAVIPQGSGPGHVFAATAANGILRSTDNGASWVPVNSGLTTDDITALAVSGTNLFAGTWGNGVFLSTDDGADWNAVNSGMNSNYVEALAVSGANIFAGTTDAIYLSTNSGTSWKLVNSNYTESFAVVGTNVFALNAVGVILSTDNGSTWSASNSGLPDTSLCHNVVRLGFQPLRRNLRRGSLYLYK